MAACDRIGRSRALASRGPVPRAAGIHAGHLSEAAAAAVAPRGRLWADPFLVELDGAKHVLFEDAPVGGRGRIAAAALLPGGAIGPERILLQQPYHLSYPFPIRRGSRTFLLPESGENRTVDLYEVVGSPARAVHRATLLSGLTALDPTVVEVGGRLRLFVFVVTDGRASGALHLFSADALEGPWESHAQNPIVTDARSARPAGAFLEVDGHLVRPAQSAIPSYGAYITFQEVLEIDDENYAERPFASMRRPGLPGQHHVHRMGGVEVLDVLRRDPLMRRLRRRGSTSILQ